MRRSLAQKPGDKSVGNFSTRFSLPSFVKRVEKLTASQKDAISRTGFGSLLLIPSQMLSKNLLVELMERWDCEKRTFVFPAGEITITLLDVALILGIRMTGNPVVLRDDTPFLDLEREYSVALWNRKITVASLEQRLDSLSETNNEDFVRSFLLFMFGTFLFPNANGKIDSRYVYILQDLDKVNKFAWGAAVLADIFHWLSKRKKEKVQYVGGCLIFLQIWCFEHIDIALPSLMDCCSKFPRVCKWGSTRSHHRQWYTTKFKELETDQTFFFCWCPYLPFKASQTPKFVVSSMPTTYSEIISWNLEMTSDESNTDTVKELIEAEKRKAWPEMNQRSSVDTCSHIEHTVKNGYQLMDHLTVDMEIESGSENGRVVYGMLNLSSDKSSLCETALRSSACHYLGKERELTRCSQTSRADVITIISSDDDWDNDLKKKNKTLEKQIVELKNKLGEVTRENKILKQQLFSNPNIEEENMKLREENENLRKENQALSLSTHCLVTHLEKLVIDGNINISDDDNMEHHL